MTYFLATDLSTKTTYILEPARKGSTKLHASSMPAIGGAGDTPIPLNRVPLHIRRAARA